MRDHNTINQEDLKHVGNIKDVLDISFFKNVFTAGEINAMLNFVCTTGDTNSLFYVIYATFPYNFYV